MSYLIYFFPSTLEKVWLAFFQFLLHNSVVVSSYPPPFSQRLQAKLSSPPISAPLEIHPNRGLLVFLLESVQAQLLRFIWLFFPKTYKYSFLSSKSFQRLIVALVGSLSIVNTNERRFKFLHLDLRMQTKRTLPGLPLE